MRRLLIALVIMVCAALTHDNRYQTQYGWDWKLKDTLPVIGNDNMNLIKLAIEAKIYSDTFPSTTHGNIILPYDSTKHNVKFYYDTSYKYKYHPDTTKCKPLRDSVKTYTMYVQMLLPYARHLRDKKLQDSMYTEIHTYELKRLKYEALLDSCEHPRRIIKHH